MEWSRKSDFELHPEGLWRMQFVDWKEEISEQWGQQARLSFDTECKMKDGQPYRVSVWGKPSLHPKSKVAGFLKALGIDAAEVDVDTFTLDDFIGQKLRGLIKHYEGQDGSTKQKIADFLPYRQTAGETAKGVPDPKWDDED